MAFSSTILGFQLRTDLRLLGRVEYAQEDLVSSPPKVEFTGDHYSQMSFFLKMTNMEYYVSQLPLQTSSRLPLL
jgi:hypothetical protein